MLTKAIEIRDVMTFIPALATKIDSSHYVCRRAGYKNGNYVLLTNLTGPRTESDPYSWNNSTMTPAHQWIIDHWDEIKDDMVIDVQYLRGETSEPKKSERYYEQNSIN